jgi:DNA-binding MarR family transcriptional regulator
MADIKSTPLGATKLAGSPLFLRDEELRQAIEMLFFGYRDFTGVADDLLRILRITKQSLNRVLGQLIDEGYVLQEQGMRDRRQRLLSLTAKGRALEERLSAAQRALIAGAYRSAGAEAVEGFRKVLLGIMKSDEDRERFERATPPRR